MTPQFDLAPSSLDELHGRIGAAHGRFVDLVASVPPDAVVDSWNVRGVAAHVLTVMNRYTAFRPDRLAADPRGVDDINERELHGLEGVTVAELIDRLAGEMETFHAMWGPASGMPLDMPVPFHGGGTLDVQCALTNAVGEFLVHGFDIARACGHPWPIEQRDGELLCRFSTWIVPAYVRHSNIDDIDLVISADGLDSWTLRVRGPEADAIAGGAVDGAVPTVVISGPAAEIALLFYARQPAVGSLVIDDRRPGGHSGRPFSLAEYFEQP